MEAQLFFLALNALTKIVTSGIKLQGLGVTELHRGHKVMDAI